MSYAWDKDLPRGAVHLGSYDTAGSYEVHEGHVFKLRGGKFLFRYASGCSCWDGQFDDETHDNFDHLLRFGFGQQYDELRAMSWNSEAKYYANKASRYLES